MTRSVTPPITRHDTCDDTFCDTAAQMSAIVRGMDGKRLKYNDLVGKNDLDIAA